MTTSMTPLEIEGFGTVPARFRGASDISYPFVGPKRSWHEHIFEDSLCGALVSGLLDETSCSN